MSDPVLNSLLLYAQAALYFCAMALLLRLRRQIGVGVFMSALGVMHFIETYLAASFYVELPFGVFSPGSTVLFSGKLVMLLLLYIKEDATTVRQPIYGLLAGNFLVLGLVWILGYHHVAALTNNRTPDIGFVNEMGWLMVLGTMLLYIDALAIILIYEKLGRWLGRSMFLRIMCSTTAVLTFDQIGFYTVLHYLTDAPLSVLVGGWIAKMIAGFVYSIAMVAYLSRVETPRNSEPRPLVDLFHQLTYREKYEELVEHAGKDSLTGLLNRGRFDEMAPQLIYDQVERGRPLSLLIIDIDHFKRVNDQHGHVRGDDVLRSVAGLIAKHADHVGGNHAFRLGGEEFAVLTPVPGSVAWLLGETLRQSVATSEDGVSLGLTVSIGVATADAGSTLDGLYASADRRLYEAKSAGRDRVVGGLAPERDIKPDYAARR